MLKTRISFGTFANLRNNEQNQLGLVGLINSLKKIVTTFNNNWTFIVNSFNTLMQVKFDINKYGMYVTDNTNSSQGALDLSSINETLDRLKLKLEILESKNINDLYDDACIAFMFKDYYNTLDNDNTDEFFEEVKQDIFSDRIIVRNGLKRETYISSIQHHLQGYVKSKIPIYTGWEHFYAWLYSSWNNKNLRKIDKTCHFWTDKIKVLKGTSITTYIGTSYLYSKENVPIGMFDLYLCFYSKDMATDFSNNVKLTELSI